MTERVRIFREQHRTGWTVVAVLLALLLGAGAMVSFAMGTCHDAGGFCAGEFSSTHIEAYATAGVLAALASATVGSAFTLRRSRLLLSAATGAAATALRAVIGESLN